IDVSWNEETHDQYLTTILVHCNTTDNKLLEMLQRLGSFNVYVDKFMTVTRGVDTVYEVTLFVKNLEQLDKVFLELQKLPYVAKTERLMK
ncbi:MAG: hypothetical protein PUB18_00540, partial [bacterium]|nr:hypothetical protein [bacterium]